MPHRHPSHRPTIRRLRPLAAIAVAAATATGCTTGAGDSETREEAGRPAVSSTRSETLRRLGLAVALPPGWDGRISSGSEAGSLPAVLHAASFPLRPTDRDDVGGAASRRMGPGDLRIMLLEFPPEQAGQQGFRRRKPPIVIGPADAVAVASTPPGHAVARARFSIRGRPFSLFVEFGRQRPDTDAFRTANQVLASLAIGDRPDRGPAVWRQLRRPLALPAVPAGGACPRSRSRTVVPGVARPLGTGPAFPSIGSATGVADLRDDLVKSGWHLHKTLWAVAPRYRGPVLMRGRRLDGGGSLRFDLRIAAELRLPPLAAGERRRWRYAPSYTALRGPGCYAIRIDGTTFRSLIVFEAR